MLILLRLLDLSLTVIHTAIVLVNAFGWIHPTLWPYHRALLVLTSISWFVIGIWRGWGYCALTDWQWMIKRRLGQTDLPKSFFQYMIGKLGLSPSHARVERFLLIVFAMSVLIALCQVAQEYNTGIDLPSFSLGIRAA